MLVEDDRWSCGWRVPDLDAVDSVILRRLSVSAEANMNNLLNGKQSLMFAVSKLDNVVPHERSMMGTTCSYIDGGLTTRISVESADEPTPNRLCSNSSKASRKKRQSMRSL